MVKYKDINVAIDITTKKTLVQSLDAVVYSHDSNAVRVIAKISKNGAPLDTDKVRLLLSSCNYNGYVKDGVSIKLDGAIVDDTATFALPDDILAYQGFLRLDFYVVWSDGSNDGGQPVLFEIKKSTIDAQAKNWAITYISDFEIAKQQVSQAAQDAIDTINTDETIAAFEADKQAVKHEKDEAIVEIKARPSELDASISQARQIITNRPTELDEPIAQANQTIDDKVADVTTASNNAKQTIDDTVSNVQTVASTETGKIQQKSSEVSAEIDTVKSNAITTINSQTDLSPEVATAKSAIAKSASDTQVVADNATTAINKVVTDTQTLGQSESAKITTVLPQLQTQIQATADNAVTINQQLQDATFPAKLKKAYAWSQDGTDRFTRGKPGSHILKTSLIRYQPSNSNIDNGTLYTTKTSIYLEKGKIYTIHAKATNGVPSNLHQPTVESDKLVLWLVNSNQSIYKVVSDEDLLTTGSTFTWNYADGEYYLRVNTYKTDNSIWVDGVEVIEGSTYYPNPKDDYDNAVPRYIGLCAIDSTNPADFEWILSPEYLEGKNKLDHDKLKQAIIALGGTV